MFLRTRIPTASTTKRFTVKQFISIFTFPILYIIGHIIAWWQSFQYWLADKMWVRAAKRTPLLEDFDQELYTRYELAKIAQRRVKCLTLDHIWCLAFYAPGDPPTYTARCERCFPHRDSQFTLQHANLFGKQ